MKEHQILMNAEMVRAVLNGSKTQTRRAMKPQPTECPPDYPRPGHWWPSNKFQTMLHVEDELQNKAGGWNGLAGDACPLGDTGDRLWVRETWGVISHAFGDDGEMIDWTPDRPALKINQLKFGRGYYTGHVIYAADGGMEWAGDDDGDGEPRSAWKPSIHMPREASRITLEITNVRVERLHAISRGDCMQEGCPFPNIANETDPRQWFADLWKSTYSQDNWDSDPWVWVIEFKRVTP
ncbi:hypothetical protein HZU75_04380 [Chitinibacter fontanus]|uniref:Morphogenetic protein n=1 Tax=Chitinibacter fontanus TaxID=1737446 RepID=A0A7D5ZE92_9NEIS|nr:hypothetical protein [Chitinibacter fontanus]QLI80828.1 hypothetical protein HZU75_04380 [Chitinibacter fontanus]